MCESYVHANSKPCCSASIINSIIRWYGGSGRTVTPKLSMAPPRSLAGERAYRREIAPHSGLGVSPVRVRGGCRAPVSGGRQRPVGGVAAQPALGRVHLISRRDAAPAGGCSGLAQAASLVESNRAGAVVGLDWRRIRRVLRGRVDRRGAEARSRHAD